MHTCILHMAQLMPLPLTVSCFSEIQTDFTFLVPAHPGSPGQRAVKRVCVCVCGITFNTSHVNAKLTDLVWTFSCRWKPATSLARAHVHCLDCYRWMTFLHSLPVQCLANIAIITTNVHSHLAGRISVPGHVLHRWMHSSAVGIAGQANKQAMPSSSGVL